MVYFDGITFFKPCTGNIYTYEFNIASIHAVKRLLFRENLYNGLSAKVSIYTLETYPLYGMSYSEY